MLVQSLIHVRTYYYVYVHVYKCIICVGPFSSADMKKWFDAGYFTMELMVRRACDIVLLPLGMWTYCNTLSHLYLYMQ